MRLANAIAPGPRANGGTTVADDDTVMLEDRDEECRVLRQRCADLERQLAEERAGAETALRAALSVVFAAGEESARIQLGLPVQRQPSPRRRGHLRGLSAVVLFAMLAPGALHTAAHRGLRGHPGRRPSAVAVSWGRTGVLHLALGSPPPTRSKRPAT